MNILSIESLKSLSLYYKIIISLFITKILYMMLEYFYNKNILNLTTSIDFYNEIKINHLNDNGHLISALGITLLLIPIIFYLANKIIKKEYIKISIYIIAPFILYISSYNALNKLVDYIVDKNLNQSYNAYYLNIFKIGLINNYFKYDSYIDSNKLNNHSLTMEDKLLFINSFVLLNYDNELLNNLKIKGKESFLNIYIDQHQNEFKDNFNNYMKLDTELYNLYSEFNNEKINLKTKIKSIDDNNLNVNNEYNSFMNRFKKEYNSFSKTTNKNLNLLNNESKLLEIRDELNTYLSNKNKYESIYRNKMQTNFGKYIPIERFLDNYGKPNLIKIEKVIKEEIGNQSKVITFEQFKITKEALKFVYDEFRNKGLNPNINTDYTIKSNFINLIENQNIKNLNSIDKNIKNKLKDKFGNSDLSLDMNYEGFINSNFIKNKINMKLKEFNLKEKKIDNVIKILNSKNKEMAFKNELYFDIIKENKIIEKYLFEENDFTTNNEAKEYGIKAIKLLYIPIFALSISLISLLLNFISVLSIFVSKILKLNLIKKIIFNSLLLTIIFALPFINNTILNENLINKLNNDYYLYFKFLEFISYYEKLLF